MHWLGYLKQLDQISMSQIKIEIYLAVFEFLWKHFLMTRRRWQTCCNYISVLQYNRKSIFLSNDNFYIKLRFWNQFMSWAFKCKNIFQIFLTWMVFIVAAWKSLSSKVVQLGAVHIRINLQQRKGISYIVTYVVYLM